MLSQESEFTGGGTYFRELRKTVKLKQGQALLHPGALFHKGLDITAGTRMLAICFLDGFEPGIGDGSGAEEEMDEGNILRFE